ncbi:MAG: hypothetical protein JNK29_06940, partial [Anaerolineales bacterium]|nr:hypothetical protein [Anaerolineales bacterium]
EGRLVPPEDPGALAAALQAWQDDRAALRVLSRAARARYERHPTWAASLAAARAFLQAQAGIIASPTP